MTVPSGSSRTAGLQRERHRILGRASSGLAERHAALETPGGRARSCNIVSVCARSRLSIASSACPTSSRHSPAAQGDSVLVDALRERHGSEAVRRLADAVSGIPSSCKTLVEEVLRVVDALVGETTTPRPTPPHASRRLVAGTSPALPSNRRRASGEVAAESASWPPPSRCRPVAASSPTCATTRGSPGARPSSPRHAACDDRCLCRPPRPRASRRSWPRSR